MESSTQESINYNWNSNNEKNNSSPNKIDNSPEHFQPGPNVNLKLPRMISPTEEQKEYFKKKIKFTKKTELCKNWNLYEDCYYRETCSFAHGENELRLKNIENEKFKTKPCKFFLKNMYCPYGNRCAYKHNLSERKPYSYSQLINKFASDVLIELKQEKKCRLDIIIKKTIENQQLNMYLILIISLVRD